MDIELHDHELPAAHLEVSRMPGHWLLARMGKRVLRPGGLELTRSMLGLLAISELDHVVELAPGLGTTTRMALASNPASYVGVERDEAAARATRKVLRGSQDECRQGSASKTGLSDGAATVVFGEAMLTMHTADQKDAILREAHRVLRDGGRYGIHELALSPDALPQAEKDEIQRALSESIRVGARPLTVTEWRAALEDAGFEVISSETAAMHLLEPARLLADEGIVGAARFAANVLASPAALRRVVAMRAVFNRYQSQLCAVAIVARKRDRQR
jgi:ubiquinone/menaquinone biosynthesis C-methylase UbiE